MDGPRNNPQDALLKLRRSPQAMSAWQSAMQHLNGGRFAPALAAYHSLTRQFPDIPQLWAELALAAGGDLEFELADQAFQRALELAPNDAALHVFIGKQYYRLRQIERASACFERAVAVDSASTDIQMTRAVWLERHRRLDEALECVEFCLSRQPKNSWARYFKAFLLHRKGMDEKAETTARDLLKSDPPPPFEIQADASYLLAELLDLRGQYSEALAAMAKAKEFRRQKMNVVSIEQFAAKMDQTRRKLLADLTPETLRRWRDEADDSATPHRLACLAGAARSGTTLLEQIIGAHPDVIIFDESYAFETEAANPLQPPPEHALTLQVLDSLAAGQRTRLVSRYLKSLLRETREDPADKLLLDKNPSLTIYLPAWLRLFPRSKIIMALRDPRDVVTSCYFQNFPVNWIIVGFFTLEGTARYYSNWLDVWLRLRDLGGFDWIETRYEDVVANLETEGRRVTNFLGLTWHESQAAYYDKARSRYVHSPTYDAVAKPIYNRAVGRWKHYAEALAPLQPVLEKYCRAFGYE